MTRAKRTDEVYLCFKKLIFEVAIEVVIEIEVEIEVEIEKT